MRFHGRVGYVDTVETQPGFWEDQLTFRTYYGFVIQNRKRDVIGSKVNADIQVTNQISIVADAYARDHIFKLRCVEWQGALWSVSDVEVQPPRLVLSIGGLYNEDMESTSGDSSGDYGTEP